MVLSQDYGIFISVEIFSEGKTKGSVEKAVKNISITVASNGS